MSFRLFVAGVAAAIAAGAACAAGAAVFTFDFVAPAISFTGDPGATYRGMGTLDATDLGSDQLFVTAANGTVTVDGQTGSFLVTGASGLLQRAGGGVTASSLALTGPDGPATYFFSANPDGTFLAIVGSDFAPNATLTIAARSLSAAPEPAAWATMVAGFGAVGAALRRRRAVVRFA